MSGTSGDGVDASIIQSDGEAKYKVLLDKYFKYNSKIYKNIHNLKEKINTSKDLKKFSKKIDSLEREITLFHASVSNEIIKNFKENIDFIGFHGQTIFHSSKEKISKQLGDGKLLSMLTKKTVINNFRENDLKNGGHGAPLTPIFHKLIARKFKIAPVTFLNLGGIANETNVSNDFALRAKDIGPGMCLIDRWMRLKSKKKYDKNGKIAKLGKINKIILEKALKKNESPQHKKTESYDTKDFDINFVLKLSLKDGAATLTEYTVRKLFPNLNLSKLKKVKIIVSGGGRKNKFLINRFKKNKIFLKLIDDYGIDGDFIESQAFAFLAVRSYINLPFSFPETTGVKKPCSGGMIFKN